jgi:ELWxxDGT repeat protein
MGTWRVVLLCLLAVGCGGPLLEDEHPREAPLPEDGAVSELWWSAVPGEVRLVEDIFPPSDAFPLLARGPESLVAFRGRLFFAVDFEEGYRALWKSRGSEEGTRELKEFPPDGFGPLRSLTVVDQQLFFVVEVEEVGRELWVSDGTRQGTRLVEDLTPGSEDSFLSGLSDVGGRLLFFRALPEAPTTPERAELWRSDGTAEGTERVVEFGPESFVSTLRAVVGDTLFFVLSTPEHGTELWRTDGTAGGTELVEDIHPGPEGSFPFDLRAVGERLYFTAKEPVHGRAIWKVEVSERGAERVEDPGPEREDPRLLDVAGRYLYFTTVELSDRLGLYRLKVSGSCQGRTERVEFLPNPFAGEPGATPYITTYAVAGRKVFFGLGIGTPGPAPRDVQLWVSDGTAAGTKLLYRPLSLSDEFGSEIFALDGSVLFVGFDEETGLEPWVSDGTVEGTRLLEDIAEGRESSYPRSFTRVGREVFFVAHDEEAGNELRVLPLQRVRKVFEVEEDER